jgi:hypothetical protein
VRVILSVTIEQEPPGGLLLAGTLHGTSQCMGRAQIEIRVDCQEKYPGECNERQCIGGQSGLAHGHQWFA